MDQPTLHEDHWRWRNDDGDESSTGATFKELEDVPHTFNAGFSELDITVRLRFSVHVEAGPKSNFLANLEYNLNSGGFEAVTFLSFEVGAQDSVHLTDGEDTTEHGVTFVGSGAFSTPNEAVDDSGGIAGGPTNDVAAQDFLAFEYCVKLFEADLSDGDVIEFRLVDVTGMSTVFDSYPTPHMIANIVIPVTPAETYLPAYVARHRLIPLVTR